MGWSYERFTILLWIDIVYLYLYEKKSSFGVGVCKKESMKIYINMLRKK